MTISINDVAKVGRNLWKHAGRYYRLHAAGVTPNGCWLSAPAMLEIVDIDAATGEDVEGPGRLEFDGIVGTVPAHCEFIKA